jgi:small-conductance mechanosensitive channel
MLNCARGCRAVCCANFRDVDMPDSLAQLAPSMLAAALNLLLVVLAVPDKLATRTVARCVAFALLTAAMFHDGIVPTQRQRSLTLPDVRFAWGALEIAWWLLGAAATGMVVRTYYALGNRLREQRFMLDVVGTLLYLSASLAIITDVFDIPLKGVLATSGALAIVLGLALQSTLSDLFSGFSSTRRSRIALATRFRSIVRPKGVSSKSPGAPPISRGRTGT